MSVKQGRKAVVAVLEATPPVRERRQSRRAVQHWQLAAALAVGISVGFALLLMSVASGVDSEISHRLSNPLIRQTHLVDVDLIDRILFLLTAVVTLAMLTQTAGATFVLGVTVMRQRREEIALRRQSGVLRSRLLMEFVRAMLITSLVGGLVGEFGGLVAALALKEFTVLPVQFTALSVLGAFPVTVGLALVATFIPAWKAANANPALLRKE